MKNLLPVLLVDGYKVGHVFQYEPGTEFVYSNFTPRGTRRSPVPQGVVAFGLQYFIEEYLVRQFQEGFFDRPLEEVLAEYDRRITNYLGKGWGTTDHIADLHRLGYLPLLIKAVPEGTVVPFGVPTFTIVNTDPRFFWLTNMLETVMSSVLWKASVSATTARQFRRVFDQFARITGSPADFVQFQGHDFSFRGMCGVEDASVSGAAHLLSFSGTDTVPAIDFLENYYGANSDAEMVGVSVPATEHSVMCLGSPEGELETFRRLLTEVYPTGIVSIVSDTWDLWRVLTEYLPALKDVILARDGKIVIRPDSGDPVRILNGDPDADPGSPAAKGVFRLLWEVFGGTENANGYKVLDPHVGVIYGDGINLQRQYDILAGMERAGLASCNVVMGMGSYTYQYVTRDTDMWAVKATAGRVNGRWVSIFKDPATDDGMKRSARGLLCVDAGPDGVIRLEQDVTPEREREGLLVPVFRDGTVLVTETLAGIRQRLADAT